MDQERKYFLSISKYTEPQIKMVRDSLGLH